jgi:L-Ala-D/L-Glu epimerase
VGRSRDAAGDHGDRRNRRLTASIRPAMLHVRHEVLRLGLRDPFRIARSDHDAGHRITTVIVERTDERYPGVVGIGEGYPDRFYGETPETILAVLPLLLAAVGEPEPSVVGLEAAAVAMDAAIAHHGGAKCALDSALHDLVGKVHGEPVAAMLGLDRERPPTDFTLGLDEPSVVAQRAKRAGRFPALKIKVGGPSDLATLEAVRDVYDGALRVDANTGWQPDDALRLLPALERLGVELIEQPFPADRHDQLRWLHERSPLPIVADESAVTSRDLRRLVGVVAGVNVKLAKCGGIQPARAMLTEARELGFRTFLGCMEETSVGIAASAVVAPLADWVDLDGNLLLADDPFSGLELGSDCRWQRSDRPGLGVERRPAAERIPETT